ncbi:MAG: precorrin-6y C5,15-methyltransferase (decarboxylating) subunit CbiE [Anaerolineae bacterium]|nr:precorrin-6y C5,15-methyltransferase (decarboxylating) subunit CbiE [Anaerolineae bacterium]MDW8100929.1 precorrin-6y C5,15-methyltransferase (decarboxylating) subunit CbiE [Anaerolineae bacterium]
MSLQEGPQVRCDVNAMHKILVVGVTGKGRAGLDPALQARIAAADLLIGRSRLLAEWPECAGEKLALGANIAEMIERLRARGEARAVVLCTGDPGLYGIGGTLARHFGAAELEIVPAVSSVQLAFARIGLPWDDTAIVSAHGRPLAEVIGWARRAAKVAILTDETNTPGAIATALLARGIADCRAVVAERLELPGERITDTRLADLPGRDFASPNLLLLLRDADWRPEPVGIPRPDDAYAHRRGLITKRDVRALSLSRLMLTPIDTVWDIGAGSGAMSIEMAEQAWRGRVYAVERDPECLSFVRVNCARYGADNVTVVQGSAPAALADLPAPDAVFIGGTGGLMREILQYVVERARPGCRLALNLATLEHLTQAQAVLRDLGWAPAIAQVNLAYAEPIAELTRLVPANPVFIISAMRPAATGGND